MFATIATTWKFYTRHWHKTLFFPILLAILNCNIVIELDNLTNFVGDFGFAILFIEPNKKLNVI